MFIKRKNLDSPKNKKLIELEHRTLDNFPQAPVKPNMPTKPVAFTVIAAIVIVIAAVMLIMLDPEIWEIPIFVGLQVILVIVAIVYWIKYKKNSAAYKVNIVTYERQLKEYNEEMDRRAAYFAEAKRICYGETDSPEKLIEDSSAIDI